MPRSEDRLTYGEFLSLFHRYLADERLIAAADSEEYLNVVLLIVARNSQQK